MTAAPETEDFERGVRPVLQIVLAEKAEAVANFRADPKFQARNEELADKSTEGQLTDTDPNEFVAYTDLKNNVEP